MKINPRHPQKKVKFKLKFGWKDMVLYGFVLLFVLFFITGFSDLSSMNEKKEVPISRIVQDVKAKKVSEINVSDTKLTAVYKDKTEVSSRKEANASFYEVLKNAGVDPESVKINIKDDSTSNLIFSFLTTFLPVLLVLLFLYFLFRQARGAQENIFSFGNQKGKTFNKDFPKVTFADVAGVDEAKQEISEIVDFLKNPEKYRAIGARTPKGVLLMGPSGTGKTLLARAIAGEAKVPFISIAGSEFMEMLVGVGAARVRDLFMTAKKTQPAIIFIDEIDAIGRQRGAGIMGGHDEREQTLNQILVEMDGFTPNEQLIVIGATNRSDILDPALVRPGRFDRRVVLGLPDIEGRRAILMIHAKGKPFVKEIDWERIAKRTVGFSGADLENMLNEAAILAARLNKKEIDNLDVEEAATKVKMGPESKRLQTDEDKKITAYHESGHAMVSYFSPKMDPVHRISIVGRGLSLGHTLIPPSQDRVHETKGRLLSQIATMLGGRVAEELIFNEMTTGAADDINKATHLARAMITEYGMSDLGPINYDTEHDRIYGESLDMSEEVKAKIDKEVARMMDKGYKEARAILTAQKEKLHLLAKTLLEKETLEGEEFISTMLSGTTGVSSKKTPSKKVTKPKK